MVVYENNLVHALVMGNYMHHLVLEETATNQP
jgi:hypothetical protein